MNQSGPFLCKPLQATFAAIDIDGGAYHTTCSSDPSYHAIHTNDNKNNNNNSDINSSAIHIDSCGEDRNTVTNNNNNDDTARIQRHLSLFDLVSIGVGGTIGSGIFVLCGFVANQYAGPATCISWLISGIAASLSGLCYAELACRMPAAGSSYVYVYASMGELPAVLVSACLTLEYAISGAAVARSWGDKVTIWISQDIHHREAEEGDYFLNFNPLAAFISAASVVLLMNGVKESKAVTNFFTVTKVILVSFMALMGAALMKPKKNLTPFIPPQFGWAGIFRGATSSFFGFIGFDEVACLAQEAQNPAKNMPLSILYTLGIVTSLYMIAALALTGMQPYEKISGVSGFPVAFFSNGFNWAGRIAAFGEVFTLPIVVLISLLAQPRLQYALAKDGLLPPIFAKINQKGVLWWGTVISGTIMTLVAAFVPFDHLDDMISAGILIAFVMTDSSLILMRYDSPEDHDGLTERLLVWFNISSFLLSVVVTHFWQSHLSWIVIALCICKLIQCFSSLVFACKPVASFGGKRHKMYTPSMCMKGDSYFKTPCMPLVPCLAIFINWYLIAQLELLGILLLLLFILTVCVYYHSYGRQHSVGNNGGWTSYSLPDDTNDENRKCVDFTGKTLELKGSSATENGNNSLRFS